MHLVIASVSNITVYCVVCTTAVDCYVKTVSVAGWTVRLIWALTGAALKT